MRECLKWFEFVKTLSSRPSTKSFRLMDGSGWFKQKKKEHVVVVVYTADIAKEPENWAYGQLMLHWPHRSEESLLNHIQTGDKTTAIEQVTALLGNPKFKIPNEEIAKLKQRQQLQTALE